MGLMDQVLGAVNKVQGAQGGPASGLVGQLAQMLTSSQGGGLAGLVQAFEQKGLGQVMASWIDTGQNLPVTPADVRAVLGEERVQQLSQATGSSPDQVAGELATHLPNVVDALTPNGHLPEGPAGMGAALQGLWSRFSAGAVAPEQTP